MVAGVAIVLCGAGCGLLGGGSGRTTSSTAAAVSRNRALPGGGSRTSASATAAGTGRHHGPWNPATTLCDTPCTHPVPEVAPPPGSHLPPVLAVPTGSPAHVKQVLRAFMARAINPHEVPAPIASQTVLGGWISPLDAVRHFAHAYINWTWQTITQDLQVLAAASVGQARSAMALAASGAANDYELQHGQISNSGTVESVAPVAGHPREYTVVTREQTTAAASNSYAGLQPGWHVALATVTPVQEGLWVLSGWQPEN